MTEEAKRAVERLIDQRKQDVRDEKIAKLIKENRKLVEELEFKVNECESLRRKLESETVRAERLNAELRITQERSDVVAAALNLNIRLLSEEVLRLQPEEQ